MVRALNYFLRLAFRNRISKVFNCDDLPCCIYLTVIFLFAFIFLSVAPCEEIQDCLEFWISTLWILDFRNWILGSMLWILDIRNWILDSMLWIPDVRNWILDSGFHAVDSRFQELDSGFQVVDSGFHAVDSGFQGLDSGLQELDFGFHLSETWIRSSFHSRDFGPLSSVLYGFQSPEKSGIYKQKFPGFWNLDYLNICMQDPIYFLCSKRLCVLRVKLPISVL